LGLDEETAGLMASDAVERHTASGGDMIDSVVETLCEKVSFAGCFILAFLLILIILTVIGNLPNLSYKLPNLDLVNDIGGTVLGVATGLMFCVIIVWALKFTGKIIGSDTLTDAWLPRMLLRHNFLTNYLGL
jgi:SNF family Na+-dependent transporter